MIKAAPAVSAAHPKVCVEIARQRGSLQQGAVWHGLVCHAHECRVLCVGCSAAHTSAREPPGAAREPPGAVTRGASEAQGGEGARGSRHV